MKSLLSPGHIGKSLCSFMVRHIFWRLKKPVYVVLIGPPGSGKGTLATKLAPMLGIRQLSTGNLFREEIARGTELGKTVEPYVKSGGLVPDEITFAILKNVLPTMAYKHGAILDGFPRTRDQAAQLLKLLASWDIAITATIVLDGQDQDLIERLTERRTCSNAACGRTYHLRFSPPANEGRCDSCGSTLYQRADDKPEVVQSRLLKYQETARPMIDLLAAHPGFHRIETDNKQGQDAVLTEAKRLLRV